MAERVMWVPTGEVRHPNSPEYFWHPSYETYTPNGGNVLTGSDGRVIVRCVVRDLPIDAEIYEPVMVQTRE